MPIYDSQKKAAQKWDKKNMITLGCRLRKDVAEDFKTYCAARGITVNNELKSHIMSRLSPANPPEGNPLIPDELLEMVKAHTQFTGESVPVWIARTIEQGIDRDIASMKQRIDPAENWKELKAKQENQD